MDVSNAAWKSSLIAVNIFAGLYLDAKLTVYIYGGHWLMMWGEKQKRAPAGQ